MARKKSAAKKAREENGTTNVPAVSNPTAVKDSEKKTKLSMDSGDEDDTQVNETTFKVNAEFAKRFQYNKERGELHRLQEMEKRGDLDDSEDGSDEEDEEDEDEFGELDTPDVALGINTLLDPNVKFFEDPEAAAQKLVKSSTDKPMYLKDYHRRNLLEGGVEDLDDEFNSIDGEKTYVAQQREDRDKLISEIHNVGDEDEDSDDDEDGFLKKRNVERQIEPVKLPEASQDNEESFLKAFIDNKAWVAEDVDKVSGEKRVPSYGDIVSDSDDGEFQDLAEQFEDAYNFHHEDAEAATIVSYARSQNTVRRNEENSRKKQRDKKREKKEAQKAKKEADRARLKNLMVKDVMNKFDKLKTIIGDEETANKFNDFNLDDDFESDEWDKKMKEIFSEEFYSMSEKKPGWNDDIDIEDIVPGIDDSGSEEEQEEKDGDGDVDMEKTVEEPTSSSRKDKKAEKGEKKKQTEKLRSVAEKFVEDNIELAKAKAGIKDEDEDNDTPRFRYREVSPESFGLTSRDILLADDKDLNEFVGLKQLASYREDDRKKKDKRKYGKKKRLREWRKSVFQNEEEPEEDAVIAALHASTKKAKVEKTPKSDKSKKRGRR
ncbi:Krr1-domain-containing protein [Nadsonia fulvescens var. elongata DSM 6958]|uniref:Krr1-domain-containing protein n=1 Tax=Nadsonia fulvescens var. elongata DSM 6958 TaxID=857566 RepID=A0A1E3PP56_9ASCO|nr:Krr1-domain-containing protein [Nadsonia fulvescens var. elongata DSM 6958]